MRNIMEPGDVFTCIENVYEKVRTTPEPPTAPEWVNTDLLLYTKDKDYIVTECICLTDNFGEPRDWIYPCHNDQWLRWNTMTCECCGHNSHLSEPRKFFNKHFINKVK